MAGIIQTASKSNKPEAKQQQSINSIMNSILDREGMRKRFDELLGSRTPQFLSSIVSLINADKNLQRAFMESPMTVIQSALKAATFDLPIEPSLGYAYIIPFNNSYKDDDGWHKQMEARFVIGYKGLVQLCLRTGAYSRVPDAVDVRQGELITYDRLTGDCEFKWEEDDEKREQLPVIGYAGYFRLKNGAEKTIYMTVKEIEAHERKNRKGKDMGKGWRDDFDAMARKTVIRKLTSKYGLMSIQYQKGDDLIVKMAKEVISGDFFTDDDDVHVLNDPVHADYDVIPDTGEVKEVEENAE